MVFEETELRLGLPGNNKGGTATEGEAVRKRGFCDTETVDLMLNLSSKEANNGAEADPCDKPKPSPKEKALLPSDPSKPPAK